MIRRRRGREYLLINQTDHAALSGAMARRLGNHLFAAPCPFEPTVAACANHDAGWHLHDSAPTVNRAGEPLDVFETPLLLALRIWSESADIVQREHGDYAGLLVSLHGMGLSTFAASRPHDNREMFELNKFQHREVERQGMLRQRLGLPTDVPLSLGLAAHGSNPADDRLAYNFGLLQVVDRLSLAILCTTSAFGDIEGIRPRPEAPPLTLDLTRASETQLTVCPWPFAESRLIFDVPARVLPMRTFRRDAEFQTEYNAAPIETLRLEIAAQ